MTTPPLPLEARLRHLLTLTRALRTEAGTVHDLAKGNLRHPLGLLYNALEAHEKSITGAVTSAARHGQAEHYFDNEGALYWEIFNLVRTLPDARHAFLVLIALRDGQVLEHATGQPVGSQPFPENPLPQAA